MNSSDQNDLARAKFLVIIKMCGETGNSVEFLAYKKKFRFFKEKFRHLHHTFSDDGLEFIFLTKMWNRGEMTRQNF